MWLDNGLSLRTASPSGLSSRESMITPLASSHCHSDHSFCDWQITTGTGLSRLSSGTGFTVEVEPGRRGVRFELRPLPLFGSGTPQRLPTRPSGPRAASFVAKGAATKNLDEQTAKQNCRSRTVPFSFEQTGILRLGPPFKERAALQRVPPRRGPFLPSS